MPYSEFCLHPVGEAYDLCPDPPTVDEQEALDLLNHAYDRIDELTAALDAALQELGR